jgi:hypothetical protein
MEGLRTADDEATFIFLGITFDRLTPAREPLTPVRRMGNPQSLHVNDSCEENRCSTGDQAPFVHPTDIASMSGLMYLENI